MPPAKHSSCSQRERPSANLAPSRRGTSQFVELPVQVGRNPLETQVSECLSAFSKTSPSNCDTYFFAKKMLRVGVTVTPQSYNFVCVCCHPIYFGGRPTHFGVHGRTSQGPTGGEPTYRIFFFPFHVLVLYFRSVVLAFTCCRERCSAVLFQVDSRVPTTKSLSNVGCWVIKTPRSDTFCDTPPSPPAPLPPESSPEP